MHLKNFNFIFFLDDLLILLGAGGVRTYCLSYGHIIFLMNIVILAPNVVASIFRAEGDAARATNPMMLTAVLNIILDPIMIYGLDLGIFGAGLATVVASFLGFLGIFAAFHQGVHVQQFLKGINFWISFRNN